MSAGSGDSFTDEAELIRRTRQGDGTAFRELYRRYSGRIFAFLLRLSGRRDLAEDLHQETWLAAARHAGGLRPSSDFGAWLFTVARNHFRSARRRVAIAATHMSASRAPPTQASLDLDTDPTCRDLEMALAELPDNHREILLLVGVEGLSIDRVAAVLEIRPDAVRQRLARARAALAAALDDGEEPAVDNGQNGGGR